MSISLHPDIHPDRDDIAVKGSEPTGLLNTGLFESESSPAATRLVSDNVNAHSIDAQSALQYQLLADRQATLLNVVALYLDQENLKTSLIAVCEALHEKFQCTRVLASLIQNDVTEIVHISQQSSFDSRSGEVQLLKDAMDCLLYTSDAADE